MLRGALFAVILSASAWAQDAGTSPQPAAPPSMPQPAPELAQFKPFLGTWKCEGTLSVFGAAYPTNGRYTMKSDLNGFWISTAFDGDKQKGNPAPPFVNRGFFTFHSGTKKWLRVGVDSIGDLTTTEAATGWTDKTFTWTGNTTFGGQALPFTETLTRVSDKVLHVQGGVPPQGQGPAPLQIDYRCTK